MLLDLFWKPRSLDQQMCRTRIFALMSEAVLLFEDVDRVETKALAGVDVTSTTNAHITASVVLVGGK